MVDLSKIDKEYSLSKELGISIEFIKNGLSTLQKESNSLENYFTIFLLLSTGFERYLKVILCLFSYEKKGRFKTKNELKSYGHNILDLKKEILEKHYSRKILDKKIGKSDFDFLQNDPILNSLLKILSDFAQSDRYIFLDNLVKKNYKNDSPERRWEFLELQFLPPEKQFNAILGQENYDRNELAKKIVIKIEKFLRAITRSITLSDISSEIKKFGENKWNFVLISDKEFGTNSY